MNLKTYRARTMAEALAEVKKDLGSQAVIVHTRTFRTGGVLGVGGQELVEITASDTVEPPPREPEISIPQRLARVSAAIVTAPVAPALGPIDPPEATIASDPPRPTREEGLVAAMVDPGKARPPTQADGLGPASFAAELASIKKLVNQVLQTSRQIAREPGAPRAAPPPEALPDPVLQHYMQLLENQVAAEIADDLVATLRATLSAADLNRPGVVREAVRKHLADLIPVAADNATPSTRTSDERPLTIALIGPTGVGKTTTVAKLAAQYKLRHGKRVGLITTDTYRIAAVDQLRTYAEIIGLPLRVTMSPSEMQGACAALADSDVILIDTAGRSPRDSTRLDELREFLAAARPHQTHLVLSSAAAEQALLHAAERFATLKPDRVIFTKLDEAANLGVVLNVARRINLHLSYLTNGQEVPDHLEATRADRLAALVMDPALAAASPQSPPA